MDRPIFGPPSIVFEGRLWPAEEVAAVAAGWLDVNYGQTENGFITADTAPDEKIRPDCVGRAAPGIDVRIGDDPLDPFPPGKLGRVWFRSPWYMEGDGFPPHPRAATAGGSPRTWESSTRRGL